MKEAWKEEINAFELRTGRAMKKGDFAEVFGKAFLKAFTPETVQAAFRATGIYPFNPDVITEKQMKPSLVTSTKATFPLPRSTPVHRVMAVSHYQPQTDIGNELIHFTFPPIPKELPISGTSTPTRPSVDLGSVSAPSSTP